MNVKWGLLPFFAITLAIHSQPGEALMLTGNGGSITIPNIPPFNALGSTRLEMRIINVSATASCGSLCDIFTVSPPWQNFGFSFSQQLFCVRDYVDSPSAIFCTPRGMSLAGLDIVARIQRDVIKQVVLAEIVNYQTGAVLASGTVPATATPIAPFTFGLVDDTVLGTVKWIKWFSTVVPIGTPFATETTPADLADWRFEGSLLNQGTGNYNVTLSIPGATYVPAPTYPPVCILSNQSLRAGFPAQLDGSASYSGDGTQLAYAWQQIPSILADIPMQHLTWDSTASVKPTITGLAPGPVNLELTVTQGDGRSTSCTVHDGAVQTNDNGVVVVNTPNAALNDALNTLFEGPQVQLNKNPWPYYDQAAVWYAAQEIADFDVGPNSLGSPPEYQPWWNLPAQGTVTVANNSGTVVGLGTNFLSTICNPNGTPSSRNEIVVWYPTGRIINGIAETGRRGLWAAGCTSDTQFTVSSPWPMTWTSATPGGANLQYAVYPAAGTLWGWQTAPANFYDSVQAFYQLYFRSGIDTYLIAARKWADRFWSCPEVDRGAAFTDSNIFGTPHANSMSGLVLRALDNGDGHPDMWAGLHNVWQWEYAYLVNGGPTWSINVGIDPREYGYSLAELTYCARWDQDSNLDAPGGMTYQAYCRKGIEQAFQGGKSGVFPKNLDPVQNGWLSWYEAKSTFDGQQNVSKVQPWSGSTVSLIQGSTAVACTLNNCNWQATDFAKYDANSRQTCASGSTCAYMPVVFADSVTFPVDSSHTDPVAYCQKGCTFIDANHFVLDRPYAGSTGTHGWVFTVSNGTVNMGGWGQDVFLEGIVAWAFDLASKAMACTSSNWPTNCDNNTSALAASYLQDATEWIIKYAYMPNFYGTSYLAGYPSCEVPTATTNVWCNLVITTSPIGAREIMGDAFRGLMAAYRQAPNNALQNILDDWYAGMWAKPGVTSIIASPDGLYDANFDESSCLVTAANTYPLYSNCAAGTAYYVGGAGPGLGQKFFGQFFGISDMATWPAIRPSPVTVSPVSALTITTGSLPTGQVNTSYSATLTAAGGTAPYSWISRRLNDGLILNPQTGQITGTPTDPLANAPVTFVVTDSSVPTPQTATVTLNLTVSSNSTVTIATNSLPSGVINVPYSSTLSASGGAAPYNWQVLSGTLPAGLTLNPQTGLISGSPTTPGASTLTFEVTDSSAPTPQMATVALTLTVSSVSTLTITTVSLPNGQVNVPYSFTLAASGGAMPYTWSSTRLFPGLVLNPQTGQITGTPTNASSAFFTFTVTDSSTPTQQTASVGLTLTISPASAILAPQRPVNANRARQMRESARIDGRVGLCSQASRVIYNGPQESVLPGDLDFQLSPARVQVLDEALGLLYFLVSVSQAFAPRRRFLQLALSSG